MFASLCLLWVPFSHFLLLALLFCRCLCVTDFITLLAFRSTHLVYTCQKPKNTTLTLLFLSFNLNLFFSLSYPQESCAPVYFADTYLHSSKHNMLSEPRLKKICQSRTERFHFTNDSSKLNLGLLFCIKRLLDPEKLAA